MKVYCDTSTLLNNVKRHDDAKTLTELSALERLLELRREGKIEMVRSRVALRELERTKDLEQLTKLRTDYKALDQVPLDEKVVDFHNQYSRLGGASYPLCINEGAMSVGADAHSIFNMKFSSPRSS